MNKSEMIKQLQSLKKRIEQHYQDLWHYEEVLDEVIAKLLTIEVSEDCISREYLEEEYWQTLIPKEMINTDVELGINIGIDKMHDVIKNAPSIVPTVRKNRQVERAEGEWKRTFDGNEWYWYCSNCKEQWYEDDLYMGGKENR